MLQAAFARRALDVHHRPAGLGVTPAGAPALHGVRVDGRVGRRLRLRGAQPQQPQRQAQQCHPTANALAMVDARW